jgi:hypothetical protein
MLLYLRSVTSQGHAPTPSPSNVFTFGLVVESIKEFGGVSTYVGLDDILIFVLTCTYMFVHCAYPGYHYFMTS